ncbi:MULTISPECIES: hypothetical protein [unclassified Ensifer]|uniref:hypothetical protein n=1 Tax=unclassified Ensifer TaxID=2633371 RepID=UPI00301002D1
MKTVKFPVLSIFNARDQLRTIIADGPKSTGYSISEVRAAVKVLDKLDEAPADATAIELEDAEHAFVLARVKDVSWTIAHADIIAFTEAIENPAS